MPNIFKNLVVKFEGTIWLGRLSSSWKDNIKTDPKDMGMSVD
jgi:hypothetical protein